MSDKPIIAAFDVATKTGVCWGAVGCEKPSLATWDLNEARWEPSKSRPARLNWFFKRLELFLASSKPVDQLWYEEPLNIRVLMKIGARDDTVALLRGAIGVLELAAYRAGITQIRSFSVQDAREHLTGQRRHARKEGKAEVMRVARMLGVDVKNDNEGDAFCGWSYACGLANPRLAVTVTPLFHHAQASTKSSRTTIRSMGRSRTDVE